MKYPNNGSLVAAKRTTPEGFQPAHSVQRVDAATFLEEFQLLVRQLYLSTPRKTKQQRQLMRDVLKGRYAMRVVEVIADVARESERVEHREAFAEFIRKYSSPSGQPLCVIEATNREDSTNGPLNLAQRAFEQRPSLASKQEARDAAHAQLARTREYIDALEATPVYQ